MVSPIRESTGVLLMFFLAVLLWEGWWTAHAVRELRSAVMQGKTCVSAAPKVIRNPQKGAEHGK